MSSSLVHPILVATGPIDAVRLFVTFAGLYIVYLIGQSIYNVYFSPMASFPGPKINALTQIPRLYHMTKGNEVWYITKLHSTYGPIVRLGPRELSFAEGAQAWKDIYGFNKSGLSGMKDMMFYTRSPNGVYSLIVADQANHSRQRKILSHSFSDRSLREQEPLLKKWAAAMKARIEDSVDKGLSIDLVNLLNCTTFDIMGDLTFSEDFQMLRTGEVSPWVKAIFLSIKSNALLRAVRSFAIGKWLYEHIIYKSPTLRAKAVEHFNNTADRVDRRLEREPAHPDLMTKILEKERMDGLSLDVEEHKANALLFMTAGTETTATALSGVTHYLLRNPSIMSKLTNEIRSSVPLSDTYTLDSLAKLPYLNAVLQEGLRIYPPVPAGLPRRTPRQGVSLCGKFVPGDVAVSVAQYATYHQSSHFHLPNEFHPERWLGDPAFASDNLSAVEPFSVGPRNCLGKNLAWHEMRVLLVTVLRGFDVMSGIDDETSEEESGLRKEGWARQSSWTLWEKTPLMVKFQAVEA